MNIKLVLLEKAYKERYGKFLGIAFSMCKDIDKAKDLVQDAFLYTMTSHVNTGVIEAIDAIIIKYLKWTHLGYIKKDRMAEKHAERYLEKYLKQHKEVNARIEFYPLGYRMLQNVQKLSKREKIVVENYILLGFTKDELTGQFKTIKRGTINSHRTCALRKLKKADPSDFGPTNRGNDIEPSTFEIIKLRNEQKLTFKEIGEKVGMSATKAKARYHYHCSNH